MSYPEPKAKPKRWGRVECCLLVIGIYSFVSGIVLIAFDVVEAGIGIVLSLGFPFLCFVIGIFLNPNICAKHDCKMSTVYGGCPKCDQEDMQKHIVRQRQARVDEIAEGVRRAFEGYGEREKRVEEIAEAVFRAHDRRRDYDDWSA